MWTLSYKFWTVSVTQSPIFFGFSGVIKLRKKKGFEVALERVLIYCSCGSVKYLE